MSKKKILLLFRSSYIIDQFYPKIAFDILQIFENVPLYFILYLEEHFVVMKFGMNFADRTF